MLQKPKCPVIAIEEHYWDAELAAHFAASRPARPGETCERLHDLGDAAPQGDGRGRHRHAGAVARRALDAEARRPTSRCRWRRRVNDRLHAAVAAHPTRFAGFAALPTADPKAAADELERTRHKLGFKGAMIHGLANGVFLDDKRFWPIFERAEALDVPIYLHPVDAACRR